ncbi:MAG: glycosyltransferase family 2 protein [Ferruginibacter sp.]
MEVDKDIRREHLRWQFPDFECKAFEKKSHNYAVCVFVINEGERIHKQLQKMKTYSRQADIVVADGGSTDGSLEASFLKKMGVRALLTKKGNGKLSAQMRMAFAYAMHEGYEGIIVVDGNGKDDISAIPQFIELLDKGYDHIQGSRFIPGGKAINTPLSRHVAVHFIHAPLLSLASRHRHTDTTNGFRAYSRRLLLDENIDIFRDVFQTYELHYYLAVESARSTKKYRLIETPVTRAYPKKGKTPTKISPIKGNLHIMGVLIRAASRKYRPQQQ